MEIATRHFAGGKGCISSLILHSPTYSFPTIVEIATPLSAALRLPNQCPGPGTFPYMEAGCKLSM